MVTSPRQNSAVELFDIKNSYYIGNYQQCIKEAQKLKPSSPEVALERDIFLYRAYLAQKKLRIVLDEINQSSPSALQPLRLLAEYLSATSNQTKLLAALDERMEKGHPSSDGPLGNQVAATIYCQAGNWESALRALHQDDDLESWAMVVCIYLSMDRVDLARKQLKQMQEADEDATLTQLATAWLNIALGGDKLQDAFYILQELVDKYGVSCQLLVGQAACQVGLCRWEEADSLLHDAQEQDNADADAAINAILVNHHFNKITEANRMLTQLKESSSKHRFVKEILAKEDEFDRLEAQYAAEK
ncbi:coatomer subunit epsilon-like [Nilaparvata lugens]|uniref:coatomer subunit epsilon-like n=1 Tax=Nilaparvata lugens TaxID=108931 RepID=UPI00193E4B63|nr:coatomer subunit epsilon-like [Nilaparvata lugens]